MKLFKKIRTFLMTCLLLFSTLLQSGYIYMGYKGDKPELYSVAWANLLTADGCWQDGCERFGDSVVYVLEEDSQGRVLYTYFEGYAECMNLLIIQKKADGKAYYYPEDCYVSFAVSNEAYVGWCCNVPTEAEMKEIIATDFTQEEINTFKTLNDWDEPIKEEKCDKTAIVTRKPKSSLKIKSSEFESVMRDYYAYVDRELHPKNISLVWTKTFIMKDEYGRELYFVVSDVTDYTDKTETMYHYQFAVIFQKDKSYDVSTMVLLEDVKLFQEQIKQMKTANNWNQPIE